MVSLTYCKVQERQPVTLSSIMSVYISLKEYIAMYIKGHGFGIKHNMYMVCIDTLKIVLIYSYILLI